MSLIERAPTFRADVKAAEDKVNQAFSGSKSGFFEGFVGDYEDFGSWFSSGLTGLLFSELLPEDQQKDLYIKRNSVNYGLQKIEETIQAFTELNNIRGLSDNENNTLNELILRRNMMKEELGVVYKNYNGDIDAPIDEEGKSFNDRWGVSGEEAGVIEFVNSLLQNPKYAAGMFSAEIVKDLPLSVLSYFGLTAKGTSGVSLYEKIYNGINKIQPKALRGITKVGAPVVAGAGAGAGYEASYSLLNEGKINKANTIAGAEFGAAFGLLGSAGLFAKNFSKSDLAKKDVDEPDFLEDERPDETKEATPQEVKEADEQTQEPIRVKVSELNEAATGKKPKKTTDKDFPLGKNEPVSEVLDSTLSKKDIEDAENFLKNALDNHESLLFPQLKGYKIKEMPDDYGSDRGATLDGDTILWNSKQVKKDFNDLQDSLKNTPIGQVNKGAFNGLTGNLHKYIRSPFAYSLFQLAHEKANLILNRQGRTADSFPASRDDARYGGEKGRAEKQKAIVQMALEELNRMDNQHNLGLVDKSVVAANRAMVPYREGKDLFPIDFDERLRGVKKDEVIPYKEPNSQLMNFLENRKALATFGLAAAGYASGEEDAPYRAAAGALFALGGPALYRKMTEVNVSQTIAKARYQASLAAEGNAVFAEQLEFIANTLGDRIAKQVNQADMPSFLEALETGAKDVNGRHKKLLQDWRDIHRMFWRIGNEDGLWAKSKLGHQRFGTTMLSNYVSHIIKGKIDKKTGRTIPLSTQEKEDLIRKQAKALIVKGTDDTVHRLPRKLLGTIEELRKQGYDVVDDPRDILSIYSRSLGRALFGRKMLKQFKEIDLSNTRDKPQPALFTDEEFSKFVKLGKLEPDDAKLYSEFDHPSLKGYKVHANVKNILDDYFEIERTGGANDFFNGLLKVNNALKRVFVFGSLFHAQALFLSGVYSMGLTGAIKGVFGKGKLNNNTSWHQLKLGDGDMEAIFKEAKKGGLIVGNTRMQELVNPGKIEIDKVLDRLGGFGVAGKKAFSKLDDVTWNYLHDRFKIAAYLRQKEILMRKGMGEARANKEAATFANDAFGSLNWDRFATQLNEYAYKNPGKLRSKIASNVAKILPKNKRKWLNLGLFAPDWTISNLRIVGRTFWNAPKVTTELVKRVHKGKWSSKDAKEMVQAWNMYAAYSARAGIYTSMLWWTMTEMFSDKEPTAAGLFDFWFGEQSGKLDLGGGESQVISKQIAEPIHFIQHPQHTLLNKMSIIPKTMMEGFFNKQWFSMKKGFPMGPAIVDDDESHYGRWILGKFIPIVANPIITDDLPFEERVERVITGFFGFPQYGKPQDFESIPE
jgi:hypothetical protein